MAALIEKGLPSVEDRLLVSDRVHIILQQHIAVDGLEEKELGGWSLQLQFSKMRI